MRKRVLCFGMLMLLTGVLTACGVPVAQKEDSSTDKVVGEMASAEQMEADGETDTPPDMLPGLDAAALKNTMPEEDYTAFEAYFPVLEGEKTFRWVAGPYDGYPDYDWEPFDADMAKVRDRLWDGFEIDQPPETLMLDRLAIRDIDGDGVAELILLFQDGAYQYLILHMVGEDCYGTTFGVRWFMSLRENGVYEGSGGAGSSTYYRMSFRDGIFQQQELGSREEWGTGSQYKLDGEIVTKETFDAWQAENLPGEVTWYAPNGSVIPENQ